MESLYNLMKNTAKKSLLPLFEISADIFDKVLEIAKSCKLCEKVTYEQFEKCRYGFNPKCATFYYEDERERYLSTQINNVIAVSGKNPTKYDRNDYYHQGVFRCAKDQSKSEWFMKSINGRVAYNIVMSQIKKKLSKEDIEARFKSFDTPENAPYHLAIVTENNKISKFENCLYIDMNSAHGDAIKEAFPEIAKYIDKLYTERKEKPINKNIMNYFVGYCKSIGHNGFYYWVVNRTRNKLITKASEFMNASSRILYANTDGIIINNPDSIPQNETEIGKFKVEYTGPAYTYRCAISGYSPYSVIQMGAEIKSYCPNEVRKYIDLANNKAVIYKLKTITENNTRKRDIEECQEILVNQKI